MAAGAYRCKSSTQLPLIKCHVLLMLEGTRDAFSAVHAAVRRTLGECDHPKRRQRRDVAAVVDHVKVVGVRGQRADDGHQEDDHERVYAVHHADRDVAAEHPAPSI